MLKVFRDNLKYLSWILWIVIAVFVLFVFVDFGAVMPNSGAATAVAATVGREDVTLGEFERTYRNLESTYRQIYGERFTPELAKQFQLATQALNQVVDRKLLVSEAEHLGLKVGDGEIRRAILEIPAFQDENGRFVGDEVYGNILRSNRFTISSFESQMREDLLLQRLDHVFSSNAFVADEEIEKAYRDEVERAKIRYLTLPAERFEGQVEISEGDLAGYFSEHRGEYALPEHRRVSYLLVDVNRLRRTLELGDEELLSYYDSNQEDYVREEQVRARHILIKSDDETPLEQARERIADIRKRLEDGADFAAIARETSEDPGSAARGGDLGFFGRGQMTGEFEKAAFDGRVGDLVGPVATPFGVHLIEIIDHRPGGQQPFEEVKNVIRARLTNERVQATAEARAKEAAAMIPAEDPPPGERLAALAQSDEAFLFEGVQPFAKGDSIPGLGRSPAFSEAAFALEADGFSEPVRVPRGWAILHLDEVIEPRDRDLDEVRAEVSSAVADAKQKVAAIDRLTAAKAELEGGKSLDEIASALEVEIDESDEFGPKGIVQGLGYNFEVTKAAFALDQGEFGGPFETPDGGVLFEVIERQAWDPVMFSEAKDATRKRLEGDKVNRLRSSLLRDLRRDRGVIPNRRLLENFGISDELQG